MIRWILTALVLALCLMGTDAFATGRFYGTLNATYQRTSTDSVGRAQSELLVNYEDLLFTKNSIRLATNILARHINEDSRWDVRPIYYFDLKSNGYTYNGSYSPYSQTFTPRLGDSSTAKSKLYYRDWRNMLLLAYGKYPTLHVTYNVGHTYDRLETRQNDTRSRNVILESNYLVAGFAMRATMTQSRNTNKVPVPEATSSFRTYNGALSYSRDFGHGGFASGAYSLLDTKIQTDASANAVPTTSKVHSVTGYYSSPTIRGFSGMASYSGRFTRSNQNETKTTSRDQDFTGQLGYSPLKYLSFDMTKIYQIGTRESGHHISEYLTLSSTFNRFLRRGVDSRVSWTRTYIQQADADASADSTQSTEGYSVDNYYVSLAAQPYPHTHMLADLSISRNNDRLVDTRRYLVTRSLSLILNASRRLECRIGANFSYQGPVLALARSYSRNVNAGASYNAPGNINLNATYIHSVVNSTPRLSNSTLAGYLGYTYREKMSIYLSANQRLQEAPDPTQPSAGAKQSLKPYGLNGQVQYRLSSRSTLSLNYARTGGSRLSGTSGTTSSWQAVFNGQF